jgi:hypothetical protein
MNLSFLLGILPTFIFWDWLRPQRDQVVHRFRFLGRLPGAPGGTRSGNRWGELDERFHTQKLPKCPWLFFWRCQFCLGYSAIHNSIGGTTQKRSHGQTRRYTFSSALPFVAYEATKSMKALGSWVLVLKMEISLLRVIHTMTFIRFVIY